MANSADLTASGASARLQLVAQLKTVLVVNDGYELQLVVKKCLRIVYGYDCVIMVQNDLCLTIVIEWFCNGYRMAK